MTRCHRIHEPEYPDDWMSIERAGQLLTFVTSRSRRTVETVIGTRFPSATRIDVRDGTAREVFVALARRNPRAPTVRWQHELGCPGGTRHAKGLREARWLITAYGDRGSFNGERAAVARDSNNLLDMSMLFVVGTGVFVAAAPVQADLPTRIDAFGRVASSSVGNARGQTSADRRGRRRGGAPANSKQSPCWTHRRNNRGTLGAISICLRDVADRERGRRGTHA